jgi:hypothetical protein
MKRKLVAAGLFFVAFSAAYAQAPTPSTQTDNKQPDVFLDNHRPLIQKKDKAPTSRTVSGIVTDDSGQPLQGALVTVTESKTKEKREFFTKKDGRYTFDDLAFTEDYQVQAKWKRLISEPRKVSQYDHTAKVVRLLQVQTPEGYTQPAASAAVQKDEPKK